MQVAKPKKGYKLVKTSFGMYEEIPEEWEYNDFKKLVFFQAEDGIRDSSVTGVQTCALPIFIAPLP